MADSDTTTVVQDAYAFLTPEGPKPAQPGSFGTIEPFYFGAREEYFRRNMMTLLHREQLSEPARRWVSEWLTLHTE